MSPRPPSKEYSGFARVPARGEGEQTNSGRERRGGEETVGSNSVLNKHEVNEGYSDGTTALLVSEGTISFAIGRAARHDVLLDESGEGQRRDSAAGGADADASARQPAG